jgi:molecular chaperone DnaK (HSP70)
MLENEFPNVEITRYDPIHAVARGAAIYAHSVFKTKDIKIRSVLNKTFGLKMGIDGEESVCNLLYRNVTLPMSKEVVCRPKMDDQDVLDVAIYENRSNRGELHTPLTRSRLLKTFHIPLTGRISRGRTKIYIRMSADLEGMISIEVECNNKKDTCDLGSDIYLSNEEFSETMHRVRMVQ